MTWREHCAPIISEVLREMKGEDEKTIRKAIRAAYPYGERAMHPYKVWCDEVRRQLHSPSPQEKRWIEKEKAEQGLIDLFEPRQTMTMPRNSSAIRVYSVRIEAIELSGEDDPVIGVCEVLADSAEQAIRKAGMTLVQKLQKE